MSGRAKLWRLVTIQDEQITNTRKKRKKKTVGLTGYNFLWVSRKIPVLVKLCDGTHWETEAQSSWREIPMQLKPQNSPARTKSQKVACATNTTARFVRPKRGGELLFSVKNHQKPHTYNTKRYPWLGGRNWKSELEIQWEGRNEFSVLKRIIFWLFHLGSLKNSICPPQ